MIEFKPLTAGGNIYVIHTRCGRNPDHPLVGEVRDHNGVWHAVSWTSNGSRVDGHWAWSLVPAERWVKGSDLKHGDTVTAVRATPSSDPFVYGRPRTIRSVQHERVDAYAVHLCIDANNPHITTLHVVSPTDEYRLETP